MIVLVNLKFYKGPHEYIGRPSVLGNPYSHKEKTIAKFKVPTIDKAVDSYDVYLRGKIVDGDKEIIDELKRLLKIYKRENLILGCWCFPFHRCHGDVIETILEEIRKGNITLPD